MSATTPANRPSAPRAPKSDPLATRAVIATDRLIYRFARRWLLVVNLLALSLAALPLIAPFLRAAGSHAISRPIDAFFGLLCHQRDDRSFHVFGERLACCQRCFAIYGGFLAAGVVFAYLRSATPTPRPLRPAWTALLCAPLLFDGFVQLGGGWESTTTTRVASGLLFAVALSWFLLPYLERGFSQIRRDLERLFSRLAAQGRASPLPGVSPLPPSSPG
ncbi:MAG TPA: DUF2085 domain-containing protein [Methylomirabilota bacterium]|nr:DUF2085 domain-containing protein [Methylomirabilota bacterium]